MSDDPVPISDALSGVIRAMRGSATTSSESLGGVFGRWDAAVGEAVAKHVQPVKLDGQRLVVEVDDPAWATQLRFLESTVRERLREVAGADVREFEVRVRRPR